MAALCRPPRSGILSPFIRVRASSGVLESIRRTLAALLLVGCCQSARSEPAPLITGIVPNGVPLYYQIHGAANGPPVVLLHGFGGFFDENRYEWIIDFFADYKLIGLDVRGHGRSGKPAKPEDYGLALVDDLNRLLDHLKLDEAHIVGVSMGGIVGLKFASLHPDKVRSLTLVGQGLVPPENYEQWVEMGNSVVNSSERTAVQEENLHMYSGFLVGYPPLLVTDEEARVLRIPLLVVIGDQDERLESARKLKSVYPATRLVVAPGFDHFDIMTPESPFYTSITRFLIEHDS